MRNSLLKLEGNVFLRRVPTVCIATPRADKSLSCFYAHPYIAAQPAAYLRSRTSVQLCLRRDASTEKLFEGGNREKRISILYSFNTISYMNLYIYIDFLFSD